MYKEAEYTDTLLEDSCGATDVIYKYGFPTKRTNLRVRI